MPLQAEHFVSTPAAQHLPPRHCDVLQADAAEQAVPGAAPDDEVPMPTFMQTGLKSWTGLKSGEAPIEIACTAVELGTAQLIHPKPRPLTISFQVISRMPTL